VTVNESPSVDLGQVADWIARAERVTVLTGAGISTDSGIADFRGPNGMWTKDPEAEKVATLSWYLRSTEIRQKAWQGRLTHPAWTASPNPGHRALVDLERSGRLRSLITQNVDGLHQRAGNDPSRIIEVHGSIYGVVCWACGDRTTMASALDRVRSGEDDPACRVCGGVLKSTTISFGQALEPEVIDSAFRAAEDCDVFIAIGTTLKVRPVANCVPRARNAGSRVVIINADPTPYDSVADAVIGGSISDVLPTLMPAP
jgi:NAD-dependent deacetylase